MPKPERKTTDFTTCNFDIQVLMIIPKQQESYPT